MMIYDLKLGSCRVVEIQMPENMVFRWYGEENIQSDRRAKNNDEIRVENAFLAFGLIQRLKRLETSSRLVLLLQLAHGRESVRVLLGLQLVATKQAHHCVNC